MVDQKECCGCGACMNICPRDAIIMDIDKYGFYIPKIIQEKCIHCDLCNVICKRVNEKVCKENEVKFDIAYAGYLQLPKELLKSASGGFAYSIMRHYVKNGGVVFGVRYKNDFRSCYYTKAETIRDCKSFRGSKYIQSLKGHIFREVKDLLNQGRNVLFIGLPCDVAGLKAFLNMTYDNLLSIDLICYGCTSPNVADRYISYLETKYHSRISDFTVKNKSSGWEHTSLFAGFESGKSFTRIFRNTEYGIIFNKLPNNSCTTCKFRGANRRSDFTIGDYWGITTDGPIYNANGVSIIFPHNERAAELIEQLPDLVLDKVDANEARIFNESIDKNQFPIGWGEFRNKYARKGLKAAHDWKFCARLIVRRK
jgi:coenzyme F420-reducing hydrogenase beta subunit